VKYECRNLHHYITSSAVPKVGRVEPLEFFALVHREMHHTPRAPSLFRR